MQTSLQLLHKLGIISSDITQEKIQQALFALLMISHILLTHPITFIQNKGLSDNFNTAFQLSLNNEENMTNEEKILALKKENKHTFELADLLDLCVTEKKDYAFIIRGINTFIPHPEIIRAILELLILNKVPQDK